MPVWFDADGCLYHDHHDYPGTIGRRLACALRVSTGTRAHPERALFGTDDRVMPVLFHAGMRAGIQGGAAKRAARTPGGEHCDDMPAQHLCLRLGEEEAEDRLILRLLLFFLFAQGSQWRDHQQEQTLALLIAERHLSHTKLDIRMLWEIRRGTSNRFEWLSGFQTEYFAVWHLGQHLIERDGELLELLALHPQAGASGGSASIDAKAALPRAANSFGIEQRNPPKSYTSLLMAPLSSVSSAQRQW